ncbi:asparaginase [candidate division KSB1 bacterium]|nr:asparaginase [candidate division KSB1 bacterium]
MKLLILFCGGTLVMEQDRDGVLVAPPHERAVRNLLTIEPKLSQVAELAVTYIDNIDSTNINPSHWDKIARTISEEYNKYDGFIITHGTDTMAYTSSALSFALQNIGKPVILTGSQIPGSKIETDARRNLINAVRVATHDIAGVMIVFYERIIWGTRASKVSESKLNAFQSLNWDLLGEIRIDIRFSDNHFRRHDGKLNLQTGYEQNIAVATFVPGTPTRVLLQLLESGIKGLVLRGYGSGNVGYEYLDVLREAGKQNIPVVVNTQCMEGATLMHLYDVGKKALDLGVIQGFDMGIETCVTKLMWALKHADGVDAVREIMHTNYCNEINIEGKLY